MTVGECLAGARMLLAKGWDPHGPYRPPRAEEWQAERIACGWDDPNANVWTIESVVMRACGGDLGMSEQARGVLDEVLGSPVFCGSASWGGAIANEWEQTSGRKQTDVLRLLAKAASRAARAEAA